MVYCTCQSHRQAVVEKISDALKIVLNKVVKVVDFIKLRPLNSRVLVPL